MRKILVVALVVIPSMSFAGEATGQLQVGIRIVAGPAVSSVRAVRAGPRTLFAPTNVPSRRYVREGRNGTRIHVTEF